MKSHELMLISVYPEMLEDIQAVCQTMHIEPTILQWEIAQQGLLDKLNPVSYTHLLSCHSPRHSLCVVRRSSPGSGCSSGLEGKEPVSSVPGRMCHGISAGTVSVNKTVSHPRTPTATIRLLPLPVCP